MLWTFLGLTFHCLRPISAKHKLLEGSGSRLIELASGFLHQNIGARLQTDVRQVLPDKPDDLVVRRRQMGPTFHFPNQRRREARLVGRRNVVFVVTHVGSDVAEDPFVQGGPIVGAPLSRLALLELHLTSFATVVVSAAAHRRREFSGIEVLRGSIVVNHARWCWTGVRRATDGCARVIAVAPDPLPRWRLRGRHERGAEGATAGRCCTPVVLNKATSTQKRSGRKKYCSAVLGERRKTTKNEISLRFFLSLMSLCTCFLSLLV